MHSLLLTLLHLLKLREELIQLFSFLIRLKIQMKNIKMKIGCVVSERNVADELIGGINSVLGGWGVLDSKDKLDTYTSKNKKAIELFNEQMSILCKSYILDL